MVEEAECFYYGIPEYILDGIHPEEDTILQEDRVEEDQAVSTSAGDVENDVDDRNGAEVKLNIHTKYHNDKLCENYDLNPGLKSNIATRFLLSYANHHISSIFIIVLFISSLLLSSYVSIFITAAIIIVIVAVDVHFTVGIRTMI